MIIQALNLLFVLARCALAANTTVSFDQALQRIIERSPTLAAERAKAASKRSQNLSSHLSLLPTLSVQAGHSTNQSSLSERSSSQKLEGVSTLNLFRFGSDFAAMNEARREDESLDHQISETLFLVEERGTRALIERIQNQYAFAISKHLQGLSQEALRIAKERYQRGHLSSQEVDKVSIDVDNATAGLRDSEIALAKSKSSLVALLGEGVEVEVIWPWKPIFATGMLPHSFASSSELKQRPDWQKAELQVEIVQQRMKRSFGKIFPSLDASLSYGYYDSPLLRGETAWTGGITLTMPLFDRLNQYGEYRSQVYAKQAAEMEFEKLRREAKAGLESQRTTFDISLETARSREQTVQVAKQLYQSNLLRFKRGIATANELAIDQSRLHSAELLSTNGWGSVHTNFMLLCHAVGTRITDCIANWSK